MKALQQVGHGDPRQAIQLIDLPDPDPGPDDIVLEMLAVPVHGLDVRDATDPSRVPKDRLPKIPRLEGCGRVVFVGKNVPAFQEGDLALPPPRSGTYRQYICAPANDCYSAPKEANPKQLALVLINGMTSALLFDTHNDLAPGRWIIHNAANSSCGRWLVALINQAGLRSVNIVRREDVFDSLTASGADACVVDTGEDDFDAFAARVEGVTGGADLHLGFDTIAGEASRRHCQTNWPGAEEAIIEDSQGAS